MNSGDKKKIDNITEAVYSLTKGDIPKFISINNYPNDEIKQLSNMVNTLIQMFHEVKETGVLLSQGILDINISKENFLASPFKQLRSSLHHLTWQTQQIAKGDYTQSVDFMGDFSVAFNSMVNALDESRNQLIYEIERSKKYAETQKNYLSIMAHDIRTPLGSVMGFSDILLNNESLNTEAKKNINIIKRSCESLLVLINNILEMAKLNKNKIEIDFIPFNLRDVINDIDVLVQSKLNSHVTYKTFLDNEIPFNFKGDPHRLNQILFNLIGNATKFTKQGNISLQVSVNKIVKNYYYLTFTVKDTGIGISKDKIETIFDAFTQADISISSNFGGTGLGLSIAAELVTLMKGKLEVSSIIGTGTSFFFTIPLQIYAKNNIKTTTVKNLYKANCKNLFVDNTETLNGIRILLVDDCDMNRILIAKKLEKYKVNLTEAENGREGVNLALNKKFDVVLMDHIMPEMNGIDAIKKIRKVYAKGILPIFALTADNREEIAKRIYEAGANDIIPKPIIMDDFIYKLQSIL